MTQLNPCPCMPLTRVFQIVLIGKGKSPPTPPFHPPTLPQLKVNGIAKGFNLYGVGDLRRSNFDHLNLFQSQKQHSVNIEHRLKSKLA